MNINDKNCTSCGINKSREDFHKSGESIKSQCKECCCLKKRIKYRDNAEHYRAIQRKYDSLHKKPPGHGKEWVANNKEKVNAKHMVFRSVKKGEIVKSLICAGCGESKRLDGHHQDYSKPLDVVWLCRPCHMFTHKIYAI